MNVTAKRSFLVAARNSLIIFVLVSGFLFGIVYVAHTNLAPAAGTAAAPAHDRSGVAHAHG